MEFFSETLGSPENPLPSSIEQLDKIWVIVTDLFSSLNSVFEVPLSNKPAPPPVKDKTKPETKTTEIPKPVSESTKI